MWSSEKKGTFIKFVQKCDKKLWRGVLVNGQTHLRAMLFTSKKEYERGIVWRWCFQHAVLELTVNWRTIDWKIHGGLEHLVERFAFLSFGTMKRSQAEKICNVKWAFAEHNEGCVSKIKSCDIK